MELSERHLTSRVAASILFAVFAYLGLLLGGSFVVSTSAGTNTLSSSGKDSQSSQITARDVVRGILATERKIAPKQAAYDAGPAAIAVSPIPEFAVWASPSAIAVFATPSGTAAARAHQPRAPPLSA
jgi:hypothetical protein